MGGLRRLPGVMLRGEVVWPETDDRELYLNGVAASAANDEEILVACGIADMKDLLQRRRDIYPPFLWRPIQRKVVFTLLKKPSTIAYFTGFGQAEGIVELMNCLPKRMQRKLLKDGNEEILRAANQGTKLHMMQSRWWRPYRPSTRPNDAREGSYFEP